ncbi:hypothetical protein WN943_014842 [Citrus x changshan-huyou]
MQAIHCSSILSGVVADHFVILVHQNNLLVKMIVEMCRSYAPLELEKCGTLCYTAIATSNNIARRVNLSGGPFTFP